MKDTKTCCDSLNFNCNQGRNCPRRLYTLNTDGSDSDEPRQWLMDFIYSVILVCGSAVISLLIMYFLVTAF